MAPISCFIIAKNEELSIERSIKSVKNICDEIIVVDSGSTDRTIEIARNLGAKVVFNEWPGYLAQKIYGESLCSHDWVLNIDADEEITEKLQEEIGNVADSEMLMNYKAYRINFVILLTSEEKPRLFSPSNKFVRLYNKNYVSFSRNNGLSTHDDVKFDPNISKKDIYDFINNANHRSWTSLSHLVDKSNFYSSQQALGMYQNSRKISSIRLLIEFPLWLIKAFFIRRYFVFGIEGFIYSSVFAFSRFLRVAKLRELQSKNTSN
ncbi:MAG: glycosyltransferase family 2 protein [Alphaproteobacteria bacterium]|nr:glycosyltransferase family 2 protein [Alphaproteobacteria bacterium]